MSDNNGTPHLPTPEPPVPPPFDWRPYAIRWGGWLVAFVASVVASYFAGRPLPEPPEPPIWYSQGWVENPDEVDRVIRGLEFPSFADTPAGKSGDELPAHVYLWDAYRKINGGTLPPTKQQGAVGACVSFGTATAVERTMAAEIAFAKKPNEYKRLCEEVIYGGSRVEVGGGRLRGDGSVGAWAAKWVRDWGMVSREVHGAIDLREYSESRAREYGSKGVPDVLEPLAKEHPVQATALLKSWADAKKALANGYGIAICSNQGFSMQRDSRGICKAQGSWAHCVPYNTMISTRIPKPCQDVQVGDMVLSHDGEYHAVRDVYTREFQGDLRVLKTFGTVPVKFTPEHPVLIYRRHPGIGVRRPPAGVDIDRFNNGASPRVHMEFQEWEDAQPQWVPASSVKEGDYLICPMPPTGAYCRPDWISHPRTKNKPNPVVPSDDLAWLFGVYIADGCANQGHRITITFNRKDRDKAIRAETIIRNAIGINTGLVEEDTFVRVNGYSADVADSFRQWFGTSSQEKRIPEWLLSGWPTQSLVDGVLAGDGCRYRGACIINTTSPQLVCQLHLLLVSLGQYPTMTEVHRNGGGFANASPMWTVSWRPEASKAFMRHWRGMYLMPVREVSDEPYSGTVWNYEVEGSHSYLAWNVVSHNCMALDGYEISGNSEYGHIENSWGADAHKGPVGWGSPSTAGFWAESSTIERMLKQGDSWAFSSLKGFPARVKELDWYVYTPRRRNWDEPLWAIGK